MANFIKVLVVEDVDIAQKVAKLVLMELGCDVDIAENGQKALSLFKENQYDIVFMDLGLPDIDGFNVTMKIREIEKSGVRVPIIALTANFNESHKPRCLAAGMDEFMLKPITKENGMAMINKFVNRIDSRNLGK